MNENVEVKPSLQEVTIRYKLPKYNIIVIMIFRFLISCQTHHNYRNLTCQGKPFLLILLFKSSEVSTGSLHRDIYWHQSLHAAEVQNHWDDWIHASKLTYYNPSTLISNPSCTQMLTHTYTQIIIVVQYMEHHTYTAWLKRSHTGNINS